LGLVVGIPLKLVTNKPFIPYGPFLGAGAILVIFAWGPIWYRTRGIFGDWYGLLILSGLAGAGFLLLMGLLVVYRSIPGKQAAPSEPDA
jgi:leader peptidase (prepilin peptidase) / N-methyltransferase